MSLIFSIVAQATRKTDLFTLNLPAIANGQVWRVVTPSFVWSTSSELVFGSILIYIWRLFERQFGSRKFGGALVFLSVGTTLLQSLLMLGVGSASASFRHQLSKVSGPYGVVFGLLFPFFLDIPQSFAWRTMGVKMSDKLIVYILALQLVLVQPPASLVVAAIAFVLGMLYRWESLPFWSRCRIPAVIARGCSAVMAPLLDGSFIRMVLGLDAPRRGGAARSFGGGAVGVGGGRGAAATTAAMGGAATGAGANIDGMGAGAMHGASGSPTRAGGYQMVDDDEPQGEILAPAGFHHAVQPPAGPTQVNQRALEQLMSMGFGEEASRQALMQTHNNAEAATHRLIG